MPEKIRAYAQVPGAWIEALTEDYATLGFRVESGPDWVRVWGLDQGELDWRLGDPLAERDEARWSVTAARRKWMREKPVAAEEKIGRSR